MFPFYTSGCTPFWYFPNLVGKAGGGGKLTSFSSLTRLPKPIYMDSEGTAAYPNPLDYGINGFPVFHDNAFFFLISSANDGYYLEFKDAQGALIATVDDYFGGSGGGGGGGTVYSQIENYVINNQFWRWENPANPVPNGVTTLCPSVHDGIGGTIHPDITFVKANSLETDTLTFENFPFGIQSLTADITPPVYLNYHCLTSVGGETAKYIDIPITPKVMQLSGSQMTFVIYAKDDNINSLSIQSVQFFGDGPAATPIFPQPIGAALQLTTSWKRFTVGFTMPSVLGKNPGECGNDAIYMRIVLPTNVVCNISLAKPALYLGSINPDNTWESVQKISPYIDSPRTGQTKITFDSFVPYGWVLMNDGVIGSASSVLGVPTRRNIDTFPLFYFLWNTFNNSICPVLPARGANAVDDFVANKVITLNPVAGRVLAAVGLGHTLGQSAGSDMHTNTIGELASHNHPPDPSGSSFKLEGGLGLGDATVPGSANAATTGNTGGSTPWDIRQPTAYGNILIKL